MSAAACLAIDPPPWDASESSVRRAIARQIDVAPDAFALDSSLREELGLDSLDLSLVALRLEREARREFPFAVLELVVSVDELVQFVRAWAPAR